MGKWISKSAISFAIKSSIVDAYRSLHMDVPKGITAHSVGSTVTNAAFTKSASWRKSVRPSSGLQCLHLSGNTS